MMVLGGISAHLEQGSDMYFNNWLQKGLQTLKTGQMKYQEKMREMIVKWNLGTDSDSH